MSAQRRIFPEAFKREAVDRIASSGLSVGKVATELGLHETVLRRWVKQFSAQATGMTRRPITQAAAPSPSDVVSEVARLRRENERLRMERDVLKKAALIFGSGLPMKFGFVDEHRNLWPVGVMCGIDPDWWTP